jgi:hypothetical protein
MAVTGEPDMGIGNEPLVGMDAGQPPIEHVWNRPDREPIWGWRRIIDSHGSEFYCLDAGRYQRFSGAASRPPERTEKAAVALDPDG